MGTNSKNAYIEESRWELAEQRFNEIFFGKDIVLRSKQRRGHLPLVSSASTKNSKITYGFKSLPETPKSRHGDSLVENTMEEISKVLDLPINILTQGRILRPKTAELTPKQKKQLKELKELDSFVFIKPSSISRERSLIPDSMRKNSIGWRTPSSNAAKLILSRENKQNKSSVSLRSAKSNRSHPSSAKTHNISCGEYDFERPTTADKAIKITKSGYSVPGNSKVKYLSQKIRF
jgi:hypothetical protein